MACSLLSASTRKKHEMAFKSSMLFDVLANILVGKSEALCKKHIESESFKDAAKFMVLRYLSMSQSAQVRQVILDHYLTLERMPEDIMYKWLLKSIPQQSSSFIRYIK